MPSLDDSTPLTYVKKTKIFVETPIFTDAALRNISADEYKEVQAYLTIYPDAGDLIPGC